MSIIPQSDFDAQLSLLTWALSDNMQSVGLVLEPTYTWNRGKLSLDIIKVMKALQMGNHNLDHHFNVTFKDQCDLRDMRPMTYNGRFVFPLPLGDLNKNMWLASH